MNKNIILIIVGALIILIIGAALGMVYQAQKGSTSLFPSSDSSAVVKTLSSKVIASIIAYGTVSDIQGKNITLSYNSDSVTIAIADTAEIYSFSQASGSNTAPTQTKTEFSQIKKGDSLNITLNLLSDGQLKGTSVIILPGFTTAK